MLLHYLVLSYINAFYTFFFLLHMNAYSKILLQGFVQIWIMFLKYARLRGVTVCTCTYQPHNHLLKYTTKHNQHIISKGICFFLFGLLLTVSRCFGSLWYAFMTDGYIFLLCRADFALFWIMFILLLLFWPIIIYMTTMLRTSVIFMGSCKAQLNLHVIVLQA